MEGVEGRERTDEKRGKGKERADEGNYDYMYWLFTT